jgi:O-methyltransferase
MKTLLRLAARPLYNLICFPTVRYSGALIAARNALAYSPREEILRTAMEYVLYSKLDGDYLEFGVCEGRTFIAAFHLAQRHRLHSMSFYAFDSFQGLPEITGVDAAGFQQFSRGQYSCPLHRFKQMVAKNRVDLDRVQIIPGWYGEVLNQDTQQRLALKAASIIWVDCDLYESTVPVLTFVTKYIQDGSLLIFDDWFCFRGNPERGQQKAFAEWLQRNPSFRASEFHPFAWHGNSFIIHRS